MPNPIFSELTSLAALDLTNLEDCSEESVYAPGHIQPYGIVLMLQGADLKILQVSQNVEQFFGIAPAALLGQSLKRLFSRNQVQQIADYLEQNNLESDGLFELKNYRKHRKIQTFRSILHRREDGLILELEPQLPTEKTDAIGFYHRLQAAMINLRSASNLSDLAQILAREVKAMTGFDRVMVYRFEADEHGIVIAEEKESHLESYLGFHYPATDIPLPPRKLFHRNWVRQIPDVNYTPARLIPTNHPLTDTPLDLSPCTSRGVHPCHIEYLQNMGVVGSLTISLIDDKRLWGLIACHHYSPRLVDYETRKTCEFLGQFASIELVHQQEQELTAYQTQVKAIQDTLHQAFLAKPNFIEQVLKRNATQLLDLVRAQGAALVLDEQISPIGRTPSVEDIREFLISLAQLNRDEIYLTNCVVRTYPIARKFKDIASGILKISIVINQKSYHLLWFRPEQIQTVNWAGDPRQSVSSDADKAKRLTPRKSFELWKETVQETSLPWKIPEIEAALMMRNTLMMALLEFSQTALEQAAEQAAIANLAKSQFLAKMSHELRTPLNAILGFTQIMNRSCDIPTEFQEHLGIISRSGEHLLTLINDVLEISKIEAGELVLNTSCFDLHRMLRSINDMFSLKASEKGLNLSSEWDDSVPRYACGDQAKLRQILINLLGNAVKFTTTGKIALRGRAFSSSDMPSGNLRKESRLRDPADATLRERTINQSNSTPDIKPKITLYLEVEDTGSGIPSSDLESIFEAFIQTERGRHAQGTGLGLSISRQFARLMGGDITVRSALNQGSTFTGKVVLDLPESLDLEAPEADCVMGLEPGQPIYRILVAEDVPENRQLLETLLKFVGFEVSAVENGIEAIAQWQAWQPDLILMDIQMPIMDGYEATRQIRSLEAQEKKETTPIVALTAFAFESDRTASLQAGCNDYIAKPFTETKLFDKIARQLGVRYSYAEKFIPESSASLPKTLTPEDLRTMPNEWIAQVQEAAFSLDEETLYQLIAQIPQEKQFLIDAMTLLVDNFQLEAILNLTQI
ncbi:MAG TPA: hybrid sensor histidine kinase/response regulator [Cyanobacteria bacterium UBA11372]|nr:hybrid sensor histidine kinase/response regulator [Cyanobacteria bacterium UBA11372]